MTMTKYVYLFTFILSTYTSFSQRNQLFHRFEKDTTGIHKVIKSELKILDGFSKDQLSKKKGSPVKDIYAIINKKAQIKIAKTFGAYFRERGLKLDATEFFDHAINALKSNWDYSGLEYVIGISSIYSDEGMSGYAYQILNDVLNFCEQRNDVYATLRIHSQLLNLYYKYADYETAIQEWKLIDSVILSTKKNEKMFKTLRAQSWNTAGLIEIAKRNYRAALVKFDTVKLLAIQTSDEFMEGLAGGNQGYSYFKLKEYEKARKLLLVDIEVSKRNNDLQNASYSSITLAEIFIAENKLVLASKYIDSAKIWLQSDKARTEVAYQKLLAHYAASQSDYKTAYHTFERVFVIRDSILRKTFNGDLTKTISQVDLMTKQRNIELLKAENAYMNDRVTIVNALIIAMITAFIASVFATVLYVRNYNARRKKEQDKLSEEFKAKTEIATAREEVLSTLSHEIRTPLNSVIGLAHVLSKRDPRADQKEIILTLGSSADHLLHIVNDILDFNKIQAKGISLELLPFDLRTVLNQIHSMFLRIAEDRNLALSVQVDSSIPNALIGDATRLIQVLSNLVSNGLKFTLAGSVNLNAKLIDLDVGITTIEFIVRDTGLGIAQTEIENIFLPFQQEKNIHGKFGGTGLGLTIVKNLVELMGGNVAVTSTHGEGSTFTVLIPFKVHLEKIQAATD